MNRSIQSLLLAAALSATPIFAAPVVVGVATALGNFTVNNGSVSGTANLTDGAQLKTGGVKSQVMLRGGSSALFGTNSAASIYRNRIVLEKGIVRLDNLKPGFNITTASLSIQSDEAGGQGAVRINGNKVEIAAVIGNMNVYNRQGSLLTEVTAGTVVSVDPQSGGSSDQDQNNNKKDCTGSHKKDPGCDASVPSGAGSGAGAPTIMSNTAALWIAAALGGVAAGVAVALTHNSSSSTSP